MQTNNKILLRGRLSAPPAPSHVNHGVEYFLLPLSARRLSGAEDHLNVIAAKEQLSGLSLKEGSPLTVRGGCAPSITAAGWAAGWWSASLPAS